ncbi:hypothetical protein P244_3220 [Klebsiella pneumoniae HK787]|nr:hypothetical protein P244_3220 [Klebsiella pneumoniae HK787]
MPDAIARRRCAGTGLETATAFRECLSDFEAVSTGSFSKKGE